MKKSSVINIRKAWIAVMQAFKVINDDLITVFAAQASFFIIISTIPFIILLLSLAKYFINVQSVISWIEQQIAGDIGELLKTVLSEVVDKTGISLISFTAVTTLWSSSRGVNAVTRGVSEVYGLRINENFLLDIIRSLLYTVAFICIMIATLTALVFGSTIQRLATDQFPIVKIVFDIISSCSLVVFTCVLTIFFAFIYNTAAKKGKRTSKQEYQVLSDKLPRGFGAQLPGAFLAAAGWMLFSYLYSLYLTFFPSASYIYGSLAAIVFLMLWLYFCMIILLAGAEVNKLIILIRRKHLVFG